jgi:hypothetical protein
MHHLRLRCVLPVIRCLLVIGLAAAALLLASPPAQAAIPDDEMLVNGDFEAFHVGWTEPGAQVIFHASSLPVGIAPYSGNYAAYFEPHTAVDLFQNVAIPADITFAKIHLWYWSRWSEHPGERSLAVQLLDPVGGTHYVDALLIDAYPPTNAWQPLTYVLTPADLAAIRGRTVRFKLRAEGSNYRANFLVDSVSLEVSSGGVLRLYLPTTPRHAGNGQ